MQQLHRDGTLQWLIWVLAAGIILGSNTADRIKENVLVLSIFPHPRGQDLLSRTNLKFNTTETQEETRNSYNQLVRRHE